MWITLIYQQHPLTAENNAICEDHLFNFCFKNWELLLKCMLFCLKEIININIVLKKQILVHSTILYTGISMFNFCTFWRVFGSIFQWQKFAKTTLSILCTFLCLWQKTTGLLSEWQLDNIFLFRFSIHLKTKNKVVE